MAEACDASLSISKGNFRQDRRLVCRPQLAREIQPRQDCGLWLYLGFLEGYIRFALGISHRSVRNPSISTWQSR